MQDRLIELETKFSFQEDGLQELNEILIRQQQQLDEMQRQLASLRERITELEAGAGDDMPFSGDAQRPPHY